MLIPLIENKIPFIDVRAPSEFILGAVPTSKNLPIPVSYTHLTLPTTPYV